MIPNSSYNVMLHWVYNNLQLATLSFYLCITLHMNTTNHNNNRSVFYLNPALKLVPYNNPLLHNYNMCNIITNDLWSFTPYIASSSFICSLYEKWIISYITSSTTHLITYITDYNHYLINLDNILNENTWISLTGDNRR